MKRIRIFEKIMLFLSGLPKQIDKNRVKKMPIRGYIFFCARCDGETQPEFIENFLSENYLAAGFVISKKSKSMNSKLQSKIGHMELKINKEVKQNLSHQHQISLDKSYFVEAQMKNSERWFKARILDFKLSKDYVATKSKDENSYNYYIHFEDFDKRNDDWIPYSRIRKTDLKIEDVMVDQTNLSVHPNDNPHFGMNHANFVTHQEITKFKTIFKIQLGKFVSDAWYFSPYPIFYHNLDCLYICEFCLSFFGLEIQLKRHNQACPLFHPPGDQIYRDEQNNVAVFEIDGNKNPVYCQNLAFMSKLFLDHKNLHEDMSIFLFYVLCEIENNEYHIVGYFSKIKETENNLSCILVLPFYQRKGYGKFLITFSYQLSLIEQKVGGPQKPLSDLGKQTYLSWWSQRIIEFIRQNKNESFNLAEMSKKTGITEEDIKWTMQKVKMIKLSNGQPNLCVDEKFLSEIYAKAGRPGLRVLPANIHWIPFKLKWDNPAVFL